MIKPSELRKITNDAIKNFKAKNKEALDKYFSDCIEEQLISAAKAGRNLVNLNIADFSCLEDCPSKKYTISDYFNKKYFSTRFVNNDTVIEIRW